MAREGLYEMLAALLDWWLGQIRSLVPPGWLPDRRRPDALIIAIDRLDEDLPADSVSGTILVRRGGQERPAGTLAPADLRLPAGLRLPPGSVLSRALMVPLAAARDLQAMINFEMERLTPFSADELYWRVSGLTPDRARGKLSLNLAFVLRAQVDALRPALARLHLAPSFIETESGRIEMRGETAAGRDWRQLGLSALCGALALACVALPFMRQQMALDDAAQAIAASSPAAQTALALRQRLTTAAAGRLAVAQARRGGDALQVLALLTSALPDGTWLSDLTLTQGDLTIDGQSTNAAQLITLLSAVPGVRNPSFTAPVTRAADGSADLFSLHATITE